MARQLVSADQEILSRDINNFRNSMEITLFQSFIANALPGLPAFIGGSFFASIDGNNIEIKKGIGFQEIAQTDGSSPVRLIKLDQDQTLSPNLPASGDKVDLIECRSIIQDSPRENRTFTLPGGDTEEKETLTMNKWASEIRIKENVTPDSEGVYTPSIGYVAVALVRSKSSGITSVTDLRSFYNMFDPDLFTLFGRKNLTISRVFDEVSLIEVPFEFSNLVPKIDQISVRKVEREQYIPPGSGDTTTYSITFTVSQSSLASFNPSGTYGTKTTIPRISYGDVPTLNSQPTSYYSESFSFNDNFIGFFYIRYYSNHSLRGIELQSPLVPSSQSPSEEIFTELPVTGLFITLFNVPRGTTAQTVLTLQNVRENYSVVYNLLKSELSSRERTASNGRKFTRVINNTTTISRSVKNPLHIGTEMSLRTSRNGILLSTVSPLTGNNPLFEYSGNVVSIPQWTGFSFNDFSFNELNKLLTIKLQSTAASFPSTPPFSQIRVKKGTQTRLTKQASDFSPSISGNVATFTYTLAEGEEIFKSSDTTFDDIKLEFVTGSITSEPVYRANQLTKTTHFNLVNEGAKTYVRILDSAKVLPGTEIILSHIIPPNLLDASSGSVVSSDLETEVENLKQLLQTLQTQQTENTTKIANLESNAGLNTQTNVLFGFGAVQAQALDNAQNARTEANTAFATPANRTSHSASNLAEGTVVSLTAPPATGYYHAFLAIEISKLNTLRIENDVSDETDIWSIATQSIEINSISYRLYARSVPLAQGENLQLLVQSYD